MPSDEVSPTTADANGRAPKRLIDKRLIEGLILGASFGRAMDAFNLHIGSPGDGHFTLVFAICGVGIALTRARPILWTANAVVLIAVMVIAYTPLMGYLMNSVERGGARGSAPAVVVLSNFVFKDRTLNAVYQDRVLHGLEILRQGDAGIFVATRPADPRQWPDDAVRAEMRSMRIDFPVEAVGPVTNTHDEAVAAAALARERGWDHVILVTQLWHMRRAAAAFEKAGLKVICSPCAERSYDLGTLIGPGDRLHEFGNWLHEALGYQYYKFRGWI